MDKQLHTQAQALLSCEEYEKAAILYAAASVLGNHDVPRSVAARNALLAGFNDLAAWLIEDGLFRHPSQSEKEKLLEVKDQIPIAAWRI